MRITVKQTNSVHSVILDIIEKAKEEANKGNKYLQVLAKLEPLSPLKTIERGYSIVKRDGHVVTSITSVKKDDNLELNLKDGIIDVKVI